MSLSDDRFYVGNVPTFLMLVKLIKVDPEFCLNMDFGRKQLEIESMLMAGVVGVGIRLVQGPQNIIRCSSMTRTDCVTLRIDSGALYEALLVLNKTPYAYMSLGLSPDDVQLSLEIYNKEHVHMGSATINTLDLEEHDAEFVVTNEEKRDSLVYDVTIDQPGSCWRSYLQASVIDTTILYNSKTQNLTWETSNIQTKIALYMPVAVQCPTDVRVCLLPTVLTILRSVLQVTAKHVTTLSISEDLPVRLFARFDLNGSFIRVYAGTKEEN